VSPGENNLFFARTEVGTAGIATDELGFAAEIDDPPWGSGAQRPTMPAMQLIHRYLQWLEPVLRLRPQRTKRGVSGYEAGGRKNDNLFAYSDNTSREGLSPVRNQFICKLLNAELTHALFQKSSLYISHAG
jgi:hypothetical protein